MAIKVKDSKEIKPSKIKEILTKENEWENYLLAALSLVAIILGILIFSNVLTISESSSLLADNPNTFASIITIVGVLGLILAIVKISKKD